MIRSDPIIKEVNDILTFHVMSTGHLTRTNLNDQAVLSEGMCSELGSVLFECNLKSVAAFKSNTEAIDLEDRSKKIAVQVTVRNDRKKIQETLDKFLSGGVNPAFDQLNFIILAPEVSYEKEFETQGLLKFSIRENIFPLPKIILLIASLKIDAQAEVLRICKKYISLPSSYQPMSPSDWIDKTWMAACKISTFINGAVVPDFLGRKKMNPSDSYKLAGDQADELKWLIDNRPLAVDGKKKQAVQNYYVKALSALDKIRIFSDRFDPRNLDRERLREWSEADLAQRSLQEAANSLEAILANGS